MSPVVIMEACIVALFAAALASSITGCWLATILVALIVCPTWLGAAIRESRRWR